MPPGPGEEDSTFLFERSSLVLALILFAIVLGTTVLGLVLGRNLRHLSDSLTEPFAVLQASLLGVVGLILAFGLALAVDRYESRRAAIVTEANAVGTTYLRAQTLPEPSRSRSLSLLPRYTGTAIRLSRSVPSSAQARAADANGQRIERTLWRLAAHEMSAAPTASAPRLYVETLNDMIDADSARVSALDNRVPTAVLILEVAGAALALGLLAAYLAVLGGRATAAVLLAAGLVALLLLVTFDLDRPTRGFIRVPATPLTDLRTSMELPPAAAPPPLAGPRSPQ